MIYFIGNKQYDWVKIGVSIDPNSRLSGIQTGCPVELTIFYTHDGGQSIEQKLHETFHSVHLRGEWFRLSGPIQEYIDTANPIERYQRINKIVPTDTNELVIDLFNKGLSIKAISQEIDITLSTIKGIINRYKVKLAIQERTQELMYSKLKR